MHAADIILIVDDAEINRTILSEIFKGEYSLLEAADGEAAYKLTLNHQHDIAAVLLDLHMPGWSGLQYLSRLRTETLLSDVPIFIITSDPNESTLLSTFDYGIADVIEKPFNAAFLKKRVQAQIELYRITQGLKDENQRKAAELALKTAEFAQLNLKVISALAAAIEFRSGETGKHVRNIGLTTKLILKRLRTLGVSGSSTLSDEEINAISYAAILHDVGKISIADSILNKPGKLTVAEFDEMKTHTTKGAAFIDSIDIKNNAILNYARDISLHHHERVDGRGYPEGLKGNAITIWSQVVGLADAFDALTHARCYKPAYSREKAIAMILDGQCGAFAAPLLDAFLDVAPHLQL